VLQVHERHLSTDFLLALLRAIVMQRPALRVVLMSATINVSAYSNYFGGVPIISVPGRLHPIKVTPLFMTLFNKTTRQYHYYVK
jgi:HrpA-like RNA helicase